jgi:polyhydroxybutyrate depolymerase
MASDDKLKIKVGDIERAALVHAPPGRGDHPPVPLLLVFHGGRGGPENIAKLTAFSELADRERFIVAYPAALHGNWNDGRSATRPSREDEDDLRFIEALVRELTNRYHVDRRRIYAAGLSNGAMMCHRLGLEMAGTFSAIATVSGGMPAEIAPKRRISRPLSVIGIYGTDDPLVRWDGGEMTRGAGGRLLGARASTEIWALQMECKPEPAREALPEFVKDGTSVWRESYAGCRDSARVVLYGIERGGHGWPPRGIGRTGPIARMLTGKASANLNATEVIWQFFAKLSH